MTTPAAIEEFVEATNLADPERFAAVFTEDAVLDDWGRLFHGVEAIRAWDRTDNIGVQAHFDIVSVTPAPEPDRYIAVLTVTGNGHNGTGPITFTLDGDRIRRLEITPD